ncbi:alpha beta hydrolase fold protein [Plasmopara halstedii]|uniref:Alpha beta hydrolase fold protein n=1 Tax=Plasmopara halstedii TaxID=4781 RepID=A0A0P1AFK6_PLAHL|nr:alpha beta hydrolase fold protein [Plasmopara halstedii]CEG39378.1 alpha beta hydrolase fold protein [Plasmopara halstedii]|eukprot:XP_024575747.1 alpha beta hydrolase fold protein [Plasmopara halstedii]
MQLGRHLRAYSKLTYVRCFSKATRTRKQMILTELKEVGKLTVGGVALMSALVVSGGFVIETVKTLNPLVPPGVMLQISDSHGKSSDVHVQYCGDGDVTIIFDGGVGETSFDWDKVVVDVAKFATVIAIDRPGLGFSKPGKLPRTSSQIASEYSQILEQLNVNGKLILVGHGAGGYNMRELAQNLNASGCGFECQGIVLVDALEENLRFDLESISDAVHKSLAEMDRNGEMVLFLARFGFIRLINVVQHAKMVGKYSPAALPYVEYFSPSPAHREGALRENQSLSITEQRFRDAIGQTQFDFPCVVLSHGKAGMFDSMKLQAGVTPQTLVELERRWLDAQKRLATNVSGRSVHRVIHDAGHCIPHEKPEEITKAVRALIDEIQGNGEGHRGLASLTNA